MTSHRGQLAIVLHTHMPYVESFGTWPFGEEWLWFCVAESYLRLEPVLSEAPLTIGVTPVLADQFEAMKPGPGDGAGAAGDRMLAWFADSREYVFGEDIRSFREVGKADQSEALEPQLADYRRAAARFEQIGRDLNGLFARFASEGRAELIGGPATHAIMPLLATDFGADLQLRVGSESHAARFGNPAGAPAIWLPECAYAPGVESHLARNGVGAFCVDQSHVNGLDSLENLEPVALPGGVTAAPIDWLLVDRIWGDDAYPSAPDYRSSFERTIHALMPRANHGRAWRPEPARAQAAADADDFLTHVRERLDRYSSERGHGGLCVVAIDTELLGHWWYEGPWWLEEVCAGAAGAGIELVTLSEGVAAAAPRERELCTSSWGQNKDLTTWDSPAVADFAWQTRDAELRLFDLLGHDRSTAGSPAALRAARELLALQSSDWAFIAKRATAGDYAHDRYAAHLAAYERACAALSQSTDPSSGAAAQSRTRGEGIAARLAGLAPGLDHQTLSDIRCAY
ncbi:MAG: DUF1957 domain-containing protein [Actinobacteria bacterium]|nr:DUF1957 domain-containing protein [Actinomycetota bacterium]